jgi:hypothetical protein
MTKSQALQATLQKSGGIHLILNPGHVEDTKIAIKNQALQATLQQNGTYSFNFELWTRRRHVNYDKKSNSPSYIATKREAFIEFCALDP